MTEKPLVYRPWKHKEALRKCQSTTEAGTICTEMRDASGNIVGYVNLDLAEWAKTRNY